MNYYTYDRRVALIQHAPRRTGPFLKGLVSKVTEAAQNFSNAIKELRKLAPGEELRYLFSDAYLEVDDYDFESAQKQADRFLESIDHWPSLVRDIVDQSPGAASYRKRSFSYLLDSIKRHLDDLPTVHRLVQELAKADQAQLRLAAEWAVDAIGRNALKVPEIVNRIAELGSQILPPMVKALPKLEELNRLWSAHSEADLKPASEKVETLYHASVNAAELAQKGFRPGTHRVEGLGGSNEGRISFTSDLYIAKEIGRTLKIAVMIAKGQVKAKDILEWSRSEGIRDRVVSTFEGNYGRGQSMDTPGRVMQLYEAYLGHSSTYNPVFMGDQNRLMQRLKGKNYRSVGVIAAEVDMTHPDITHYPAEREYRVPPEAVLKIVKLLK